MRALLAILVLVTTLPCDGQVRRRALGPKPSAGGGGDPAGTNTLAYLWVSTNLTINSKVGDTNPWTDSVVGVQMLQTSTAAYATTAVDGVFFDGANTFLTNAALFPGRSIGNAAISNTVFIICKPENTALTDYYHGILTAGTANQSPGIYGRRLAIFNVTFTGQFLADDTIFDLTLVCSNGNPTRVALLYTNGVYASQASTGADTYNPTLWGYWNDGYKYTGWIPEIRIYSNILTDLQVSNLHSFRTNKYGGTP